MKKRLLLIVLTIVISGCSFNDHAFIGRFYKEQQMIGQSVYKTLVSRDSQALEILFCNKIKDTHDILSQIEQVFEFINGNVVFHEGISVSTHSYHFQNSDTDLIRRSSIENLRTDTDNIYRVVIHYNPGFSDSDYIGLHRISVTQQNVKDGETFQIGDLQCFYEPIEIISEYVQIEESWRDRPLLNQGQYRGAVATNILVALNNRDTDALYNMFAPDWRGDKLFSEINTALDLINGNLLTYSSMKAGSRSGHSTNTYLHGGREIYDIISDTGEMYEVIYHSSFVNKNNLSEEGVNYIIVRLVNPIACYEDGFGHDVFDEVTIIGNY